MIDLDECTCEKRCTECDDCFVAKCECECEVAAGLKAIPTEGDDEAEKEATEEKDEKKEEPLKAKDLGIKVHTDDRLPEY
jgi:hypothetical protein